MLDYKWNTMVDWPWPKWEQGNDKYHHMQQQYTIVLLVKGCEPHWLELYTSAYTYKREFRCNGLDL